MKMRAMIVLRRSGIPQAQRIPFTALTTPLMERTANRLSFRFQKYTSKKHALETRKHLLFGIIRVKQAHAYTHTYTKENT